MNKYEDRLCDYIFFCLIPSLKRLSVLFLLTPLLAAFLFYEKISEIQWIRGVQYFSDYPHEIKS